MSHIKFDTFGFCLDDSQKANKDVKIKTETDKELTEMASPTKKPRKGGTNSK